MSKYELFTMQMGFGETMMGETCDPIRQVWCGLEVSGDEGTQTETIGEGSGWIVPAYPASEAINMADEADAISAECQELLVAVIDPETNDFREELNLEMIGFDVLCLDQIKILPEYRGRRLGLVAMWHLIETFGSGCGAVVIKPCPINGACEENRDRYGLRPLDSMSDKELAAGVRRLVKYWSKLGFKPVPGFPDYLFLDMGLPRKKCPAIKSARKKVK